MRTLSGLWAPKNLKSDWLVPVAFAVTVIFLGTNYVAVKFSNKELDPFWGAALRFLIAAAILALAMRWRRIKPPKGREVSATVAYGLLLFAATYGFLYWALLKVSAGTSSVIFAIIPLLTLLAANLLGLEKITARNLLGALTVIAGVAVIFYDQLSFKVPLWALALVFMGVITAALSGIVVKLYPKIHPVVFNTYGMAVGAVVLLALSIITRESLALPTQAATWLALSWLVASSITAFLLFVWMLGRWSPSRVSYTGVLPPVVTVPLASWLVDESIGAAFALGSLVVFAGVYIGALSKAASKK